MRASSLAIASPSIPEVLDAHGLDNRVVGFLGDTTHSRNDMKGVRA
jgi:hypothetical protein